MSSKSSYKGFNTRWFTQQLTDELMTAVSNTTEYIIANEPLDTVDPDNVVMQESTIGDGYTTADSLVLEVNIEVPYAQRRNYENYLNPDKLGYIEKGVEKAIEEMENIDYAKNLR